MINGILAVGKTKGDYKITVLELVPGHYVLLDGAHRICAWEIIVDANPDQHRQYEATVLASTMSWTQLEIAASGRNAMFTKAPDFMDQLYWIYTKRSQLESISKLADRIKFIKKLGGFNFIKTNTTPTKQSDNSNNNNNNNKTTSTESGGEKSKGGDSRTVQRFLQLARLLTDDILDKLLNIWRNYDNTNSNNNSKTKISKNNLLQSSYYKLFSKNENAARAAFLEYINLLDSTKMKSKELTVNSFWISCKHYILSMVSNK